VEDQEQWLRVLGVDLLSSVGLMLGQKLWVELDISWLVDTVNVPKRSGDGEVWVDGRESLIDLVYVLWLSVEGRVVDTSIVNTVFLTTRDTDFLNRQP